LKRILQNKLIILPYQVSIIIPLYNKQSFIRNTIKSILSQTEQNFEIIIVDDGSTDRSIDVVKNIKDDRITIYEQNHKGVSAARNLGVLKAKSDLIAFLDADDEWDENYLETIFKLKREYPNAGLYFTNFRIRLNNQIEEMPKIISNSIKKDTLITNYFELILKGIIRLSASCISLNKITFLEEEGFNINAVWGEDQDLWGRIALKHPIAYSPKICVTGDRSGKWMNRQNDRIKKTPEHPFVASGNNALKNNISINIRKDVKDIIVLYKLKSANLNIQVGNFQIAKKILYECDSTRFKQQKIYLLCWVNLSKIVPKNVLSFIYIGFNNVIPLILNRLPFFTSRGVNL
jgi:glycosyltransferase involved in cell wall biosynthesis